MGIGYGKISAEFVFGRIPISKMAAGGHFIFFGQKSGKIFGIFLIFAP